MSQLNCFLSLKGRFPCGEDICEHVHVPPEEGQLEACGRDGRSGVYCPLPLAIAGILRGIHNAQALSYNPKNYKALFRKAKALKEQGFFEKAEKILEDIIKNGPESGMPRVVQHMCTLS